MGEVIRLDRRREAHAGAPPALAGGRARRAVFMFDLASPYTYFAAERVDRLFTGVVWVPALEIALHGGDPLADPGRLEHARMAAERRAAVLRMPLVWPEGHPSRTRAAMRAAMYAAEQGRGAAFVLAASRLAFCGGFDLDDPEVLAEAAAAAGVGLDGCLRAAGDLARDGAIEAASLRLLAAGGDRLPALRVGRTLFCGEERLGEAAGAIRAPAPARRRSFLPRAG